MRVVKKKQLWFVSNDSESVVIAHTGRIENALQKRLGMHYEFYWNYFSSEMTSETFIPHFIFKHLLDWNTRNTFGHWIAIIEHTSKPKKAYSWQNVEVSSLFYLNFQLAYLFNFFFSALRNSMGMRPNATDADHSKSISRIITIWYIISSFHLA